MEAGVTRDYETISRCRVCGSTDVVEILDLGLQPLANSLKRTAEEPEALFPLRLGHCSSCSLIQLLETVRKELLFDTYVWVTGTSSTARGYAETFERRVVEKSGASAGDLVCEVASNDGTFLRPFARDGFRVVGVDPAANIADMARAEGVDTRAEYFGVEVAARLAGELGPAAVVMARNVVPHVSELYDVIEGMAAAMAADGTGVIEFHYGGRILNDLHYDSIYHEHLCYFSLAAITHLLQLHGMEPFDLDESPISGGSYVVYFSKSAPRPPSEVLSLACRREAAEGVRERGAWTDFASRVRRHRELSLESLRRFEGRTVVGFGASARSSTYLNFCGIGSAAVSAVIDNNPLKQGLHTAGSSMPVVSFDEGMSLGPSAVFVLGWNFLDEIVVQCAGAGYDGPFLVPFPGDPRVIGEAGS